MLLEVMVLVLVMVQFELVTVILWVFGLVVLKEV